MKPGMKTFLAMTILGEVKRVNTEINIVMEFCT